MFPAPEEMSEEEAGSIKIYGFFNYMSNPSNELLQDVSVLT